MKLLFALAALVGSAAAFGAVDDAARLEIDRLEAVDKLDVVGRVTKFFDPANNKESPQEVLRRLKATFGMEQGLTTKTGPKPKEFLARLKTEAQREGVPLREMYNRFKAGAATELPDQEPRVLRETGIQPICPLDQRMNYFEDDELNFLIGDISIAWCCDFDGFCDDGDDDWCCGDQYYCSNDDRDYAESNGGILCPGTYAPTTVTGAPTSATYEPTTQTYAPSHANALVFMSVQTSDTCDQVDTKIVSYQQLAVLAAGMGDFATTTVHCQPTPTRTIISEVSMFTEVPTTDYAEAEANVVACATDSACISGIADTIPGLLTTDITNLVAEDNQDNEGGPGATVPPTKAPTPKPSEAPSASPSAKPTDAPTATPTEAPTSGETSDSPTDFSVSE